MFIAEVYTALGGNFGNMRVQILAKKEHAIVGYENIFISNPDDINRISLGEAEELVIRECIGSLDALPKLVRLVELNGTLVVIDYDLGLVSNEVIKGNLTSSQLHDMTQGRNLYFADDIVGCLGNFILQKQNFKDMQYVLTFRRQS